MTITKLIFAKCVDLKKCPTCGLDTNNTLFCDEVCKKHFQYGGKWYLNDYASSQEKEFENIKLPNATHWKCLDCRIVLERNRILIHLEKNIATHKKSIQTLSTFNK